MSQTYDSPEFEPEEDDFDAPAPVVKAQPKTPAPKLAPQKAGNTRSVIAARAVAAKTQKRSFFKSDKSAPASKVELDGETFWFDALSDEMREKYEAMVAQVAAQLGLSEEEYRALPPEFFTTEQNRVRQDAEYELYDAILDDALRAWSLEVPCSANYKRDLHTDLKRDICEAVLTFSIHGVSEARFRKARS